MRGAAESPFVACKRVYGEHWKTMGGEERKAALLDFSRGVIPMRVPRPPTTTPSSSSVSESSKSSM